MFFFTFSRKKSKDSKGVKRRLISVVAVVLTSVVALLAAGCIFKLSRVPQSACSQATGEYMLSAATEGEREDFFAQFGYSAQSVDSCSVIIPSQGEVFERYNMLQEEQGLDLHHFAGKKAKQYILILDKKSSRGNPLYGVLTVYRDTVVAAHLTDFVYPSETKGLAG